MGSPASASMAASTCSRRPAASTRGCSKLATFCGVTGTLPRICTTATVLATSTGSQRLNLSLVLSQRLLDTPHRQVALAAPQVLDDLLAGDDPLLVDHIELLFDPLLQVDLLRGLKLASWRQRLLVIWPGRLADGGHLTYAEPSSPEYRRYGPADLADVAILDAAALCQVE
jgi:hypothetical protein